MLRLVQVVLTLVIFTLVMTGVGWAAHLLVPPFVEWGAGHIGLGWMWAGFLTILAACAYAGYWRPARARI